jgi:DNA-binding MarR family transcriptional regulator
MPTAKKAAPAKAGPLDASDLREDSLGYRLRRAQMHAYALFFEMLGELDLSPARLTALSVIASEPDINQATLAQRLNVAGPSVMKLIDALEGAGFIRRMAVANDRRRYSLVLTASGRAVLQTLRERHAAYEERLASALSAAEREQLMSLLQRLLP